MILINFFLIIIYFIIWVEGIIKLFQKNISKIRKISHNKKKVNKIINK